MNTSDVLRKIAVIEDHLFSLVPTMDKRKGLLFTVKRLRADGKLTNEIASAIERLWRERNLIVSARNSEIAKSSNVAEYLERVLTALGLEV